MSTERIILNGPVTARIRPMSLRQWIAKNNLPKIPAIPKEIVERYNEYLKNRKGKR